MEKEKTSYVRLGVLVMICAISLLVTMSLGVVKATFLDQNFLLEQMKATDYSQLATKEISQNFREDNLEESELAEIIATSIPRSFVEQSIHAFIQYTYKGNKHKVSETNDATALIDRAVDSYIKERQLTLDEKELGKIETMKVTLVSQFQKTAGSYYLFYFIGNILEKKEGLNIFFFSALIVFLVCQFFLMILSRKNVSCFIRCTSLQLVLVGGVILAVAGALYLSQLTKNLEFRSQAVQIMMSSYIQTILSYYVILGGIIAILGVILGLYSFVRYKKE